jgi:hypothetical protein
MELFDALQVTVRGLLTITFDVYAKLGRASPTLYSIYIYRLFSGDR